MHFLHTGCSLVWLSFSYYDYIRIYLIATTFIAINQKHGQVMNNSPEHLTICLFTGIVLTAYSPMGGPGRPSTMKSDDEPYLLEDKAVKAIADKHKATAAQVIIY